MTGQVAFEPPAGQVFLRGGMTVGVRCALEGNADPAPLVAAEVPRLLRHRIADQLAEDPAHQAGGYAEIRGRGFHAGQHPALTLGVLDA